MTMGKFTYMVKRILGMSYKGFFETVRDCSKKSGRNEAAVFFDVVYCGLKYGCGRADYKLFEFWKLSEEQRSTYLTRAKSNQLVAHYNSKEYTHILEDKVEFNQHFSDLLGRKWIDLRSATAEEFAAFMEGLDCVIAKPLDKSGGTGIEKVMRADFDSDAAMFAYLKEKNFGLAEECIVQCATMAGFNASSVNTYRICTVLEQGEAHVLYFFVRIGVAGRTVDNLHAGGLACPVDLETGVITAPGYSVYMGEPRTHLVHPDSKHPLEGFQMPMHKEAMALVCEAAKRVPQVGYVGWDLAITDNGPVLIEGNPFPGHDILQLPPHTPDGIGVLPHFRKYIPFI